MFVAYMNEDQPVRPANIANIVAINQGHRPLTMETPRARPLDLAEFSRRVSEGGLVVDTRSSAAFGAGHVPGALNIQLASTEFEQRVGWLTPEDAPLLLLLEADELADKALHELAFLGLETRVDGYLASGMAAWIGAGRPHATLPQVSVHQLKELLAHGTRLLDVRNDAEWEAGHVAGAQHLDYRLLPVRMEELKPEQDLAVVCATGMRSSTACSLLLRQGFDSVSNVTGGMTAWSAAGLPLADGE